MKESRKDITADQQHTDEPPSAEAAAVLDISPLIEKTINDIETNNTNLRSEEDKAIMCAYLRKQIELKQNAALFTSKIVLDDMLKDSGFSVEFDAVDLIPNSDGSFTYREYIYLRHVGNKVWLPTAVAVTQSTIRVVEGSINHKFNQQTIISFDDAHFEKTKQYLGEKVVPVHHSLDIANIIRAGDIRVLLENTDVMDSIVKNVDWLMAEYSRLYDNDGTHQIDIESLRANLQRKYTLPGLLMSHKIADMVTLVEEAFKGARGDDTDEQFAEKVNTSPDKFHYPRLLAHALRNIYDLQNIYESAEIISPELLDQVNQIKPHLQKREEDISKHAKVPSTSIEEINTEDDEMVDIMNEIAKSIDEVAEAYNRINKIFHTHRDDIKELQTSLHNISSNSTLQLDVRIQRMIQQIETAFRTTAKGKELDNDFINTINTSSEHNYPRLLAHALRNLYEKTANYYPKTLLPNQRLLPKREFPPLQNVVKKISPPRKRIITTSPTDKSTKNMMPLSPLPSLNKTLRVLRKAELIRGDNFANEAKKLGTQVFDDKFLKDKLSPESKTQHVANLESLHNASEEDIQKINMQLKCANLTEELLQYFEPFDVNHAVLQGKINPVIGSYREAIDVADSENKKKNVRKNFLQTPFLQSLSAVCDTHYKKRGKRDLAWYSLFCKAIAQVEENLDFAPDITTLEELFIAQQKRDAIETIQKDRDRLNKKGRIVGGSIAGEETDIRDLKNAAYSCLIGEIVRSGKNETLNSILLENSDYMNRPVYADAKGRVNTFVLPDGKKVGTLKEILSLTPSFSVRQATTQKTLDKLRDDAASYSPKALLQAIKIPRVKQEQAANELPQGQELPAPLERVHPGLPTSEEAKAAYESYDGYQLFYVLDDKLVVDNNSPEEDKRKIPESLSYPPRRIFIRVIDGWLTYTTPDREYQNIRFKPIDPSFPVVGDKNDDQDKRDEMFEEIYLELLDFAIKQGHLKPKNMVIDKIKEQKPLIISDHLYSYCVLDIGPNRPSIKIIDGNVMGGKEDGGYAISEDVGIDDPNKGEINPHMFLRYKQTGALIAQVIDQQDDDPPSVILLQETNPYLDKTIKDTFQSDNIESYKFAQPKNNSSCLYTKRYREIKTAEKAFKVMDIDAFDLPPKTYQKDDEYIIKCKETAFEDGMGIKPWSNCLKASVSVFKDKQTDEVILIYNVHAHYPPSLFDKEKEIRGILEGIMRKVLENAIKEYFPEDSDNRAEYISQIKPEMKKKERLALLNELLEEPDFNEIYQKYLEKASQYKIIIMGDFNDPIGPVNDDTPRNIATNLIHMHHHPDKIQGAAFFDGGFSAYLDLEKGDFVIKQAESKIINSETRKLYTQDELKPINTLGLNPAQVKDMNKPHMVMCLDDYYQTAELIDHKTIFDYEIELRKNLHLKEDSKEIFVRITKTVNNDTGICAALTATLAEELKAFHDTKYPHLDWHIGPDKNIKGRKKGEGYTIFSVHRADKDLFANMMKDFSQYMPLKTLLSNAFEAYRNAPSKVFFDKPHLREFDELVSQVNRIFNSPTQVDFPQAAREAIGLVQHALLKQAREHGGLDKLKEKLDSSGQTEHQYSYQLFLLVQALQQAYPEYANPIDQQFEKNIFINQLNLSADRPQEQFQKEQFQEKYKQLHVDYVKLETHASVNWIGQVQRALDYYDALKKLKTTYQIDNDLDKNSDSASGFIQLINNIYSTLLEVAGRKKAKPLSSLEEIIKIVNSDKYSLLASAFLFATQYVTNVIKKDVDLKQKVWEEAKSSRRLPGWFFVSYPSKQDCDDKVEKVIDAIPEKQKKISNDPIIIYEYDSSDEDLGIHSFNSPDTSNPIDKSKNNKVI